MRTDLFDYQLPQELIAQYPPEQRGQSRMLVLDRKNASFEITTFDTLPKFLSPEDCMVFNDTRVMRARMYGRKDGRQDGARVEILLLSMRNGNSAEWQCMLKPGKRFSAGSQIRLENTDGSASADFLCTVKNKNADGTFELFFNHDDHLAIQENCGHMPLPPYIRRGDTSFDSERYQTIFASQPGAVAAPTAGLHFTPETLAALKSKGVAQTNVTLHVGAGTFKPVSVDDITAHQMHHEEYQLSEQSAKLINTSRKNGGRLLAIGTTSVRVLESCADAHGILHPGSGSTDIFIYPPYQPKAVDMLLTNFHLPKSTLLMLVSAFAGRELVMDAYHLAIRERMRFYSYGDCMLII